MVVTEQLVTKAREYNVNVVIFNKTILILLTLLLQKAKSVKSYLTQQL